MSDPTFLFVGCGSAALQHSRTLGRIAPRSPRFYASRAGQKARSFSESYGGTGWFNSYAAGLEDQRIDVVVITTPPAGHAELAIAALEAGKHVVVEKPAFMSVEECDDVAAAAKMANRTVMVAENYHYKPSTLVLRTLIHDGAIGDIRIMWVNALKWQRAAGWRTDASLAGGGPLFEGGIHWVSLMANLGPRVVSCATDECGTGSTTVTRFWYEGGAVGVLAYSWEMRSRLKGLRISKIFGTAGSIAFESNGLFIHLSSHGTGARAQRRLITPGLRDITGTRAMWEDFLDATRTAREPRFTLDMARQDIALIKGTSACGAPAVSPAVPW